MSRYTCRMMAQHVGCLFAPAILLIISLIFQLTNANVLSPIDNTFIDFTVKSARIITPCEVSSLLSTSVDSAADCLIEFLGTGLTRDIALRWSLSRYDCYSDNPLDLMWMSSIGDRAIYKFITIPDTNVTAVYFCRRNGTEENGRWSILGKDVWTNFQIGSE